MEGSEADEHVLSRGDRPTGRAVEQITRVVSQTIPGDVVILREAGSNDQHMGCGVITKRDLGMIERHRERNVRAACYSALTVIDIPGFIEGDLTFIVARSEERR